MHGNTGLFFPFKGTLIMFLLTLIKLLKALIHVIVKSSVYVIVLPLPAYPPVEPLPELKQHLAPDPQDTGPPMRQSRASVSRTLAVASSAFSRLLVVARCNLLGFRRPLDMALLVYHVSRLGSQPMGSTGARHSQPHISLRVNSHTYHIYSTPLR